jgi:hypothetical protein
MKRSTLATLAAAPLVACASAGAADDFGAGPYDPAQVAIYYIGQKPGCGMVRIGEVQADTEGGLREAALRLRGNAVVGVRWRLVVVDQGRGYRRAITGPAAVRVFLGMAVRLDDRCGI